LLLSRWFAVYRKTLL